MTEWKQRLNVALQRNSEHPNSRYLQLATVDENGVPANRTLVFRGFAPDSDNLLMVTDQRSRKVQQIQQFPRAEICWYFSDSREQFRIAGDLALHTAEQGSSELMLDCWDRLSASAQGQFYWPTPGVPFDELPKGYTGQSQTQSAPHKQRNPPASFALLVLHPNIVEHLELQTVIHQRTEFLMKADGQWIRNQITP